MTGWWIDEGKLLGSSCPTIEYLANLHGDGFRTVISLLGDEEQADAYDREAVERIGLNIRRIPILDYGTPTLRDFRAFLKEVMDALTAGKIVVHCQYGYGRTGTMAAAYWISKGLSADDAVKKIRLANPKAVETEGQISSLRKFAATFRRDSRSGRPSRAEHAP